jgi:hypothetical protein
MQKPEPPAFDDPALKAALRRSFADEAAPLPGGLRDRIARALDQVDDAREARRDRLAPSRWRLGRGPILGMALAACVLIVSGLVLRPYIWPSKPTVAAITLPSRVAQDMAGSHQQALLAATTTPAGSLSAADLSAAVTRLSKELGYTAIAPDLGDGWVARRVSVASIAEQPTAHVVYTRGERSVSLYTVPAGRVYLSNAEGGTYEQLVGGMPLAGVVRAKTMRCVIGDAGCKMEDLRQIVQTLKGV